ncbi:MAG TPA: hypothetical protein DGL25_01475 [Dehalococcoidia bacterium]|nr:hypothetical protein [Dehalococcoidia bacterium]|tara:strand:- start:829 stop:1086 length:258 start_codon:yes stop_codon:yes gene_type:complete
MGQAIESDDPGEQLGKMVAEWAENYWKEQEKLQGRHAKPAESDLRDAVTKAFLAGALTVFQSWDEVRPLVPRRRVSWRDLPSHHG